MVLICSTHGALYDPATGDCRGGPCRGAGLEPVAVEEIDGQVVLEARRADGS
jgi:nitrite reductase/ring-hydroxylating ferredoxin subunit